jgi:hypothetical protein
MIKKIFTISGQQTIANVIPRMIQSDTTIVMRVPYSEFISTIESSNCSTWFSSGTDFMKNFETLLSNGVSKRCD